MKLLLTATIATLMFGLGLGLRASAVASLRHRPALAARVVLGSCLLVPLAALLFATLYAKGIPGVILGILSYQMLTLLLTGPLLGLWRRNAALPPPAAGR